MLCVLIVGRASKGSSGGRPSVAALLAAVLPLAAAACGGEGAPTEPEPGPAPGPSAGALEVTTATSGPEPDPDGYTVTVADGEGRAVGTDDTLLVEDLEEGDHTVELSNLAGNCGVEGENPRGVTVAAADTTTSDFAVSCEGRSAIEVTTSTVSGGLDDDGFRVAVDGGTERTIGTDDTEFFAGLASGDHTVELSGLAAGCSVDGENPRQVTAPPDDTATVVLEGRCGLRDRIAFASDRGGHRDIWVVEVDGSGDPGRLTDDDAFDTGPTWSPDGSRIAFASRRAGNPDIWVMEADGAGDPERLTDDEGSDSGPAWSPDGSRIAFASIRGGNSDIWVVDADGAGDPERLTDDEALDTSPSWSPDGSRIVFTSDRDGDSSEIYTVCVNGSRPPERLTENVGDDLHPAWSPDGSRIAFTSARDGDDFDVYVMDADGSGDPERLTENEGRHPAWSPQTTTGPGAPAPSPECQVAAP